MSSSKTPILTPLESPAQKTITILGAGIVGSALALQLSIHPNLPPNTLITVLDATLQDPAGSTAIAPGLIGQLNTIPHLTTMAKESVAEYKKIPGAFQPVGGLEIARTPSGILELHQRRALAQSHGLEAKLLPKSDEIANLAPDFHTSDVESQGLFFPGDGTADPRLIVKHYQTEARARGVRFTHAKGISVNSSTSSFSIMTGSGNVIKTDILIVASGIWTPSLLKQWFDIDLPIVPVAHPYAYFQPRPRREMQQPFLRWPERHVYARDHGECDGVGSYDHEPVPCIPGESALFDGAGVPSNVVEKALEVLPDVKGSGQRVVDRVFNGIFSVTPDGMPFVGPIPVIPGLYVAAAVWVTHAAGVARLAADIVSRKELSEKDMELMRAFDPARFDDQDRGVLRAKALATYNDIYNTDL